MLTLESHIIRSASALTGEVGAELLMMDARSGRYFNLDAIGAYIWGCLAEPVAIDSLCRSLSERYDANLETIRRDVLVLLNHMAERGLVSETD